MCMACSESKYCETNVQFYVYVYMYGYMYL